MTSGDELFAIPESLSPKLAWLRRHDLSVRRMPNDTYRCELNDETFGVGDTELEAIEDFCVKTKLKHWNNL